MKQQLTYRHYLYLSGVLLVLLGIGLFSHVQSLQETYTKYQLIQSRSERIDQADAILREQQLQQKRLAIQVKQLQAGNVDLPGHLALVQYLERLSQQHDLRILALPQEQVETVSGYSLSTERFRLEGKLHDLVRALHQLEQKDRAGSITACTFSLERILQQGKRQSLLVADLTLKRLNRK
ncbi:MAG: hypothetical protein AAF206_01215 [Bacteroidota bacterium]